ncbi:TetR/AcrR family transcriptional regulator [Okibacterium endophyticum]
MTEFTGASDRDNTLALLWREQLGEPRGTRGPRQKVSVDQIVDTAISVADDDGVEAISMRKIAERIDVSTMSLYTYVDSKSALIDLMIDRVTSWLPREPLDHLPWRARLQRIARQQLEHYRRHPWLFQVNTSRPPLGPGISDQYEYQLSAVEGIGLTDLEMDGVITLVGSFVESTARAEVDARRGASLSGQSDLEWWEANATVLDAVMDAERFRLSGRVGTAAGEAYQSPSSPDFGFEFGLGVLLDGVERIIERRRHLPDAPQ